MVSSIEYLVLGIFALVILIWIIIVIRNQIAIAAAYRVFKKKLKAKQAVGYKLIKVKKLPAWSISLDHYSLISSTNKAT